MDTAHSANDPSRTTGKQDTEEVETLKQNNKLKEDYELKIQALMFENKIKLLQQENESRMKILELENQQKVKFMEMENQNAMKLMTKDTEIQSLKHQVQMLNLKSSENGGGRSKINEDGGEALAKKMLQIEQKMESSGKENQLLQSRVDELERKLETKQNITEIPHMGDRSTLSEMHKLEWGAEKFIEGKTMNFNLYTSYNEWFEDIWSFMENGKVYNSNDYFFLRKNMTEKHDVLYLVSQRKKRVVPQWHNTVICVEGLSSEVWHTAIFKVFYPRDAEKALKMERAGTGDNFQRWSINNVPADIYYGDENSVIVYGMIDKQGKHGFNYIE